MALAALLALLICCFHGPGDSPQEQGQREHIRAGSAAGRLDPQSRRAVLPPAIAQKTAGLPSTRRTASRQSTAVAPLDEDAVRESRQDIRWEKPMPERAFADFREWTRRFATAGDAGEKARLRAEGIALAAERRGQMADLIDQNPRRALELAVPSAVRRSLPADVAALLEETVSGRGDLAVIAAIAAPGRALRVQPVSRIVTMKDGRTFDAFTFGQRNHVPTRENIAVQGVALDGKLALTEFPGRLMEPVEIADLHAGAQLCPTSGVVTATTGDEVVVDWDGAEHTFYCGPAHAAEALIAAAGDETAGGGGPVAQSPATEGTKKLLIIRVDFPDAPGQVVSDATLTNLINNMSTHWTEMSFGKMTWTTFGNGSDITPTLRLPNGHASYTSCGTMLAAARTAATAAGYNYLNYTHEVVVTGDKPDVGFGGIAFVGARGAWLANAQWNLGVCSHEVGHNFGLNHAGVWDTDDGTTIGSGSAVEYGNPFDQMGGASSSMDAHFGARQKNYLDWLVDADVVKITTNGTTTTRIRAFDRSVATGDKAIAVDRTGTSNDYWIEYRQDYADTNLWMRDGVLLNWGDVNINNGKPLLLDWTPATSSKDDCPVLIGRTFSDTAAGIHITPILRGADADGTTWIDVTVNRGAFPGNRKPSASVVASTVNPAVNASVTFTGSATDPDGDSLAYFWDWGDGTFTANNSTSATKSWSSSGTRTVRFHVTDKKGFTTTSQVLIQVGTSSTFFIQGVVSTTAGALVEGAVVRASATQSDTTDSEGYYAITGLAAGSYTLSATKTGLSIQPGNFTNQVTVGPSRQNVNFTAPPGSPYFGTMKAGLLDQGSNTGPLILPVLDADTPVTNLTLTATSSNTGVIPDASISFGTAGTTGRTVTVAAASNVSGPVNITITATDPEGGTGSYVWPVTVNARPVLSVTGRSTAENTPVDIDLRTFVTDDLTGDDQIAFELQRVRNGSIALLPDGHTARFTPSVNFNGAASFRMTARDLSLGPAVLFLYDFEPPDVATDARSTDQSNFNRSGTLEVAGVGGEYSYTTDVPPGVGPWGTQSLNLSDAGTGAARLRRTLAATDLNYNDADWSFSTWVKRTTTDSEDFIFHLGNGDGHGTDSELELFFPANSNTLRLQKWGAGGLEKELAGPNVPPNEWHHITLTYDRTGTNVGTFALYVDGFAHGSVASVAMDVSQSAPLVVGGHNSTSASLDRWFDGKFDDVLLQRGVNGRPEIWGLARLAVRHYNGLSAAATVNVTVSGTNQPPSVSTIPDVILPVGTPSAPLPFTLSDPESEARTLNATGTSSNTTLLPNAGISISPAPPPWTSGDIGAVGAAGSFIEDRGTFIIGGAGADIGPGTGDEFRWVRQDFNGDAEIRARLVSMDFTNPDAKAGVMMRESATPTSPFALACVTAGNGVSFQYRATESAASVVNATINGIAAPCWVRLVRSGNNFTASYAADNSGIPGAWLAVGTVQPVTFAAGPNAAGLAVTSKVDATVCTAVFDRLGGTVRLGGERTITLTPAAGQSGNAIVTLGAGDGSTTGTGSFNLLVDGAPPSTSIWNAATAGSLPWSTGSNWAGGVPPPSSRFSTIEFFSGQTFAAGTILSSNDTSLGHALNVLTLGGTGPTSGTTTVNIQGNPLIFRRESVLDPVVNLTATNGTGLTYNISAPVSLEADMTFQGNGTATFLFSGGVSGGANVTKTGSSRLILSGGNVYTGTTTILGGTLQIGNDGATGSLPSGNVINNGTLRFDRTGTVHVPNVITGTGGLNIHCPTSADTVVVTGGNSFTGNVAITTGSLRIRADENLGTGNKNITTQNSAARLLLDGSAGSIVLPAAFSLVTSNPNGSVVNESGDNIIAGNVTLSTGGGDTRLAANAGSLTMNGSFTLNANSRGLILGGAATGAVNGRISDGSGGRVISVTKNDPGRWTLGGMNTYSGSTTVNAGTLVLGTAGALGNGGQTIGSGTGGTSIIAGATLDLNGQQGVNEVLTIRGTGAGGVGALVNNGANAASIAGGVVSSISTTNGGVHSTVPTVTLSGTATATATLGVSAASFTINGGTTVYSVAPAVTISGVGGTGATATAVLSGGVVTGISITNPGTGYTTAPAISFSGGTVTTAGANPTGTGNASNFIVSAVTVTNPGSGYSSAPSVAFSSGSGTVAIANLSGVILGADATIGGGGDIILNAPITGAFALAKNGTGTLTLNAAATHAGGTVVNTGRLVLANVANGPFTVNGGTLLGNGTVQGALSINGGTHAPGASPGITTVNGNYALGSGGTLHVEINGITPATQYDQVRVLGVASSVSLAGTLDIAAAPGLSPGATFTILDNTSASAVSGTFKGLPQDAEFFEDGQWWRITYTGGTGNDVVLTRITPTPWQNWQAANFGANVNNAAISGMLIDIEPDGLGNLLEYALGGNPNVASRTPLPLTSVIGGRLTLTFTRTLANTDIVMTVQGADALGGSLTNLARSTSGAAFIALDAGVNVTETGGGATRSVEVRDLYLTTDPAHSRRFLRLEITRP